MIQHETPLSAWPGTVDVSDILWHVDYIFNTPQFLLWGFLVPSFWLVQNLSSQKDSRQAGMTIRGCLFFKIPRRLCGGEVHCVGYFEFNGIS